MDFSVKSLPRGLYYEGMLKPGPLSELGTFEGGHRGSRFHHTKRDLDESRGGRQQARLSVLVFTIEHIGQGTIYIDRTNPKL